MNGLKDNPSSHRYLSYADGIATAWPNFLLLVARVLAGWIFLQSGWRKLADVSGFAANVAKRGVPELLGYIAPFVEFLGGLGLVLGFASRYAALLLIAFTIAATWTSHAFWTFPEAERARQFSQFWKNVTMIGGAAGVVRDGRRTVQPGPAAAPYRAADLAGARFIRCKNPPATSLDPEYRMAHAVPGWGLTCRVAFSSPRSALLG